MSYWRTHQHNKQRKIERIRKENFMSVNKTILLGRLGKDVELKTTPSGASVANFSVATGEKYKNKSGELVETTEWHNIVVWSKLAEVCQKYLSKGSQVYLEGKLQTRSWDDKDGNKRYTILTTKYYYERTKKTYIHCRVARDCHLLRRSPSRKRGSSTNVLWCRTRDC